MREWPFTKFPHRTARLAIAVVGSMNQAAIPLARSSHE